MAGERDATWWLIGSFILHPAVLLCTDGEGPSCLTASQVAAVKQIYSPAISPRTRTELFSSLVPGTELGWGVQRAGRSHAPRSAPPERDTLRVDWERSDERPHHRRDRRHHA